MTASDPWTSAKEIIGSKRLTLGPQASQQWLHAPEHLAMVLARYRVAAALIGDALNVLEIGCGEGIGAGILAKGRELYVGSDSDVEAIADANALLAARSRTDRLRMSFVVADALHVDPGESDAFDAIVSLDVIEHVPSEREDDFMRVAVDLLTSEGVLIIGTPNAAFDHLASPQSKAGHINNYSAQRLHDLMAKYFHVVQDFGMNDVALHLGHPEARHYLMMGGVGPR